MIVPTYLTPRALLTGSKAEHAVAAGAGCFLAGQARAFTALEATQRDGNAVTQSLMAWTAFDVGAFSAPRERYAGLELKAPLIMGVVNVTPDSFSDGGKFFDSETAIRHAFDLLEMGASIIDVGGESTRPGAQPVPPDEELRRVTPVIKALAEKAACVSIDTRHAAVMDGAVAAGARIINDVTALADKGALQVAARSGAAVMLMHMQGEPQTMQANPTYAWAPGDVYDYLAARVEACIAAGISKERIAVDPGIGFGKADIHNIQILDHLAMYHGLGCAVVLGVSRKAFIGRLSAGEAADHRLPGSLAAALHGVSQGIQIVRVHDVAETKQALAVLNRIAIGG